MRGKAKFGVSIIYRGSHELRFTNLTEKEAIETLMRLSIPNDITISKQNPETEGSDTLEEAKKLANKLRRGIGFNPLKFNKTRRRVTTEYDEELKTIRTALRCLCPTLSLRRGRGTAHSWIEIWGSGEFSEFTEHEKAALEKFGLNHGANCAVISPESRKHYVEKATRFLA